MLCMTMLLHVQDPTRTILGATQKAYLKSQLTAANATHTWKIIGQQVCCSDRGDQRTCAMTCTVDRHGCAGRILQMHPWTFMYQCSRLVCACGC